MSDRPVAMPADDGGRQSTATRVTKDLEAAGRFNLREFLEEWDRSGEPKTSMYYRLLSNLLEGE